MRKLDGKKIKVDGNTFEVRNHMLNRDDAIETIILTRDLAGGKQKSEPKVTHACDLGYESIDDIQFGDSEMKFADIQVKEKESKFNIAYVTPDGELKEMKVEIQGINWDNPKDLDIIFHDESGANEVQMPRDLLLKSYLLYHEWKDDFVPDSKTSPTDDSDTIDDLDIPREVKDKLKSLIGDDDYEIEEITIDKEPKVSDDSELKEIFERIVKNLKEVSDEIDDTDFSFEGEPIRRHRMKMKAKRGRGPTQRDLDRIEKDILESIDDPDTAEMMQGVFDKLDSLKELFRKE